MWEDMCYSGGPLMSPRIFQEVLVPHYRRITGTLNRYGVDIIFLDCDGKIDALAPLWLEAGVNTMFPIEVGKWRADPLEFRRRYGKEMRLIGGVDKHVLMKSTREIAAEVERLAPLVEEGGYIPTPDHRVPPDVPLSNYIFYLEEAKRVWGKGLANLRPTGQPLRTDGSGTQP
jgi:uroporphyrinogen decarboxylase